MASKKTIILGGWAAFSDAHGLTKREEPEEFGWMSEENAFFYTDMRRALDATPGSRDFLRSLKPEDPHRGSIVDAVQDKLSPLHSGASLSSLMGCYRAALKDWDGWVLAAKKDRLLRQYKEKQIDFISLICFRNHLVYAETPVTDDEGLKVAMEKAQVTFSDGEKPLEVAWSDGAALHIVTTLLEELSRMREEEKAKWKARELKQRIEYLEWNLKHPSRWFWLGESHPSYSITLEELDEMERLHPGYRSHIALVCTHLRTMGYRGGQERSSENEAALRVRLRQLGIMSS
jgi:hypothetical protein